VLGNQLISVPISARIAAAADLLDARNAAQTLKLRGERDELSRNALSYLRHRLLGVIEVG